jgi:hypothetical protein
MLKLDLGLHTPALAEVIPNIDDCMGDVKAAVGGVIRVFGGSGIAVNVVAVEVPGVGSLAVSADCKLLCLKGNAQEKKKYSIIDSLHSK